MISFGNSRRLKKCYLYNITINKATINFIAAQKRTDTEHKV